MLGLEDATLLPALAGVVDRRVFLPSLARDKKVLHLGCVDDGLTEQKSGTGALLHEELERNAQSLVGVDISEEGLAVLESIVPGTYIHGDIESLDRLDLPACDLVIAAEVIEHLKNPHRFYSGLAEYLKHSNGLAVLTTPNAYGWVGQMRFAVTRQELVHEDHLLVYTPITLWHSLRVAGLEPVKWWVHSWSRDNSVRSRIRSIVEGAVSCWNPWLGSGLIVEVVSRDGD